MTHVLSMAHALNDAHLITDAALEAQNETTKLVRMKHIVEKSPHLMSKDDFKSLKKKIRDNRKIITKGIVSWKSST